MNNTQTKFEKARNLWEEYLEVDLEDEEAIKKISTELGVLLPFENEEEKQEWIRSAIHFEERCDDDTFEWEDNTEQKIISLQTEEEKQEWNKNRILKFKN